MYTDAEIATATGASADQIAKLRQDAADKNSKTQADSQNQLATYGLLMKAYYGIAG